MSDWPIGVFTSIDAGLGVKLEVARELGIPTIQLHAPHRSTRTAENADQFIAKLEDLGIQLTAVFGGFEGESYADIPTVSETVGLVPPATRSARLQEMKEISDFARLLGCDVVALHLDLFLTVLQHQRMARSSKSLANCAITRLAMTRTSTLKTGQETADGLLEFIGSVARSNLFINFDPANMILYGTGEPIEALRKVGSYVRSIHCKDATWSDQPGVTWGCEMPLGKGQVNLELYLRTLKEIGYRGPLTIEREIPQEPQRQKDEIGSAAGLLAQLRKQILGV